MIENSPLVEFSFTGKHPSLDLADVEVAEHPFKSYFNLRVDEGLRDRILSGSGFNLPVKANTYTEKEYLTCLWLRTDEWLLITSNDNHRRCSDLLEKFCDSDHAAWTDQSSGFTSIVVSGAKAIDLLSRGVVFDLHPRSFKASQCVQTMLAKARVAIINRTRGEDAVFEVIVRRSFADYVWRWLTDKAHEAYFNRL